MERTITVTGKGSISVKPDITRILITIEDTQMDYGKVLELSSGKSQKLRDLLVNHGFNKEDIKTLSFNVDTEYEGYSDENGNWKQKFVGYRCNHRMKVEFKSDNDLLGRILYSLAESKIEPLFNIEYTISDVEKVKNEVLERAVSDSKNKAKILADASGVTLDEIVAINYSWTDVDLVSRPMNTMMKMEMCDRSMSSYSMDIEADDIVIDDGVTVKWIIE